MTTSVKISVAHRKNYDLSAMAIAPRNTRHQDPLRSQIDEKIDQFNAQLREKHLGYFTDLVADLRSGQVPPAKILEVFMNLNSMNDPSPLETKLNQYGNTVYNDLAASLDPRFVDPQLISRLATQLTLGTLQYNELKPTAPEASPASFSL